MATYQPPIQESKNRRTLLSEVYVEKAMPSIMSSVDMTSVYIIAIFFIVNAATAASGGAAAFTYLILGAITFFIPCAIATAQLGHMFPKEGSLYNWTHKALGGYWSFFVGFCGWFPGVLVMVAGADIVVSMLQGLNSNWLVEPWQQGIVIIIVLSISLALSLQRLSVIKTVTNVAMGLIFLATVLIGLSGLVWLLKGHHPVTNLFDFRGWNINWNPSTGNINLFGLITLAYLGTEVPMNMGGEIKEHSVVRRHILWGTVLVLVGYFIATTALLIVQGANVGNIGGFSLVMNVDQTLGKFFGNITAICITFFFIMVPAVYNNAFARLLLVGGIDQRLPAKIGRLNKNRVPYNALIFQCTIAIVLTVITFMLVPYLLRLGGKPTDLATEVYNISQAAATLVWAISTTFLFVNLAIFYFRDRRFFHEHRIFPMPVLVISSIIGPIACAIAIVDTLFFSWIGALISNGQWWYIIGGLTAVCIIIAAIGSVLAVGEASWETQFSE
jgi:amino acid transporter